jgi:regulator of replication initiation timing
MWEVEFMIECSIIVGIIKAVYNFFQEKKAEQERMEIKHYMQESRRSIDGLREYMEIGIHELAEMMLNDLRTKDRMELRYIVQELIQKGEIDLAEELNRLLDNNFRLSNESFYILKGYFGC